MIVISPYAAKLPSENPKNYPFWKELIALMPDEHWVQVGIEGEEPLVSDFRTNLKVQQLRELLRQADTFVSCDSFIQHLAWDEEVKGIVLWSVSDPLIFGHPEHINLLKSRDNLAKNQFLWWHHVKHNPDLFVEPEIVKNHLCELLENRKISSS